MNELQKLFVMNCDTILLFHVFVNNCDTAFQGGQGARNVGAVWLSRALGTSIAIGSNYNTLFKKNFSYKSTVTFCRLHSFYESSIDVLKLK